MAIYLGNKFLSSRVKCLAILNSLASWSGYNSWPILSSYSTVHGYVNDREYKFCILTMLCTKALMIVCFKPLRHSSTEVCFSVAFQPYHGSVSRHQKHFAVFCRHCDQPNSGKLSGVGYPEPLPHPLGMRSVADQDRGIRVVCFANHPNGWLSVMCRARGSVFSYTVFCGSRAAQDEWWTKCFW